MTPYAYEDFAIGDRFASPRMTVTESAIIDFAMQYDPQPFHLDVQAAVRSSFDGLVSSGLMTLCLGFRLIHQTGIFASGEGSPGLTQLKWLKPVRPGDTIHTVAEVTDRRPSQSRPERGILTMRFEVVNQDEEAVMGWTSIQFVRRRGAEDENRKGQS